MNVACVLAIGLAAKINSVLQVISLCPERNISSIMPRLTYYSYGFNIKFRDMMFFNKIAEGMFKGKCFNDVIEVVRSRIRYYGGS